MPGVADIVAVLREAPPGSVVGVLGAPGSGKSRAVQAADEAGAFRRRIVFDPYAWTDAASLARGAPAYPWPGRYVTPAELATAPELPDIEPRLVVAARTLDRRRLGRDFELVADIVWHTGGVDLIAEEAGLYSRDAVDLIMRLASGGRHVGARLVLIAQSLTRLCIDARRHLSHVVAFAQGEPQDIRELRLRCGRAFSHAVRTLRPGDGRFYMWRQGDVMKGEDT